jgi:hypothetical protein
MRHNHELAPPAPRRSINNSTQGTIRE